MSSRPVRGASLTNKRCLETLDRMLTTARWSDEEREALERGARFLRAGDGENECIAAVKTLRDVVSDSPTDPTDWANEVCRHLDAASDVIEFPKS